MKPKVWLITGCSTGFGRAIALGALKAGDIVGVGARNVSDVADIVSAYPSTALAIELDVTVPSTVTRAVETVSASLGAIDVLVNNAGIGYFASVEESADNAVRRMFDVNVFGLGDMTKAVLPSMRKRRSGHIINITSIGGLVSLPTLGYYNATKYAVDGLSEALAKEVNPLGISVTIVAPGAFRTDWAGRSASETATTFSDYEQTSDAVRKNLRNIDGKQAGDPAKAAAAIVALAHHDNPPLRLVLGKEALERARAKVESLTNDYDAWEDVSNDMAFDV